MHITINYRLTGTGWSECMISDAEKSCVMTASYLSDALGNLVRAAVALLSGFSAVTFSFEEEPGEFRWVIRSAHQDEQLAVGSHEPVQLNEINLVVLRFPDLWGGRPDHEGEEMFRVRCIPVDFAQAVYQAASRVFADHGETGYAEKWSEHQFPIHQLAELHHLLKQSGHAV